MARHCWGEEGSEEPGAGRGSSGSERRERGAERRGLRARRNVNQSPEPRESSPICSDLTWLLAATAAAAASAEQINR